MRIALVHDYLTQYGGAERVLETLHGHFPDAPVVTAIVDRSALPASFAGMRIIDGGLGRIPGAARHHRALLPLYPAVFRRLGRTIRDAEVVLADSSAWAHHIGVAPEQTLVCYCHSPARFLYGDADYLDPLTMSKAAKTVMGGVFAGLRAQDQRAARRVDRFVANSRNVAARIQRVYGREATVVHPPVDLARFRPASPAAAEPWFLVVSRLVPHKRVDLAIQACRRAGYGLKVIGAGRSAGELGSLAGPTVEFLGQQSDEVVAYHLRRCRALILPGAEDFGMTAVEAQASGRPVVAYAKGGALESIADGETGLFFHEQTVDALIVALREAAGRDWDPASARANAERFGAERFLAAIDREIAAAVEARGAIGA